MLHQDFLSQTHFHLFFVENPHVSSVLEEALYSELFVQVRLALLEQFHEFVHLLCVCAPQHFVEKESDGGCQREFDGVVVLDVFKKLTLSQFFCKGEAGLQGSELALLVLLRKGFDLKKILFTGLRQVEFLEGFHYETMVLDREYKDTAKNNEYFKDTAQVSKKVEQIVNLSLVQFLLTGEEQLSVEHSILIGLP